MLYRHLEVMRQRKLLVFFSKEILINFHFASILIINVGMYAKNKKMHNFQSGK